MILLLEIQFRKRFNSCIRTIRGENSAAADVCSNTMLVYIIITNENTHAAVVTATTTLVLSAHIRVCLCFFLLFHHFVVFSSSLLLTAICFIVQIRFEFYPSPSYLCRTMAYQKKNHLLIQILTALFLLPKG